MSKGGKGGSSGTTGSLFAGILLGMVLGLAAAGVVAWYILKKNPASFETKEHREPVKAEVEKKSIPPMVMQLAQTPASAPVTQSSPTATSAVAETKQHFEFYKVLTDKPDGVTPKSQKQTVSKESSPAPPSQLVATEKEKYYIQAGSFPNADDAEKLKAKLALLGMEASVQAAVIPDRGTYHRVRLGPVNGNDELNKTMALLKQNGVANATPIRVQ